MKKLIKTIFDTYDDNIYSVIKILGVKIIFLNKKVKKYIQYQKNRYNINIIELIDSSKNILFTYSINSDSQYVTFQNLLYDKNIYQPSGKTDIDLAMAHSFIPFSPNDQVIDFSLKVESIFVEDAFLRSVTTWANRSVNEEYRIAIGYTFSNLPHFYSSSRTTIEDMINNKNIKITDNEINRVKVIINKLILNKISKYNHQPIHNITIGDKNRKKVLVIDQSYGDISIKCGGANCNTFKKMLKSAVDENPDCDIIIKTHPDTLVPNSDRSLSYYTKEDEDIEKNIYLLYEEINPFCLLDIADKVYVCTTQLGFEALMLGKEVHVFGLPFYAGWGFTKDRQKCKRRSNKRKFEEVFYIAYIMYSYYALPSKKGRVEIEDVINYLIQNRKKYFKEFNIRCEDNYIETRIE